MPVYHAPNILGSLRSGLRETRNVFHDRNSLEVTSLHNDGTLLLYLFTVFVIRFTLCGLNVHDTDKTEA